MELSRNKIIVFSHIPKTAGTSLKYLTRRHFGVNELDAKYRGSSAIYTLSDLKRDKMLYPNLSLLAGHCIKPYVDFGSFECNMLWFTFLRNPINRYVSHYVHQQTGKNENYKMDIFSWAKKFRRSNWMVRMIAGEENLDKAKEMLNKFHFIGLTEKFDISMIMFKQAFNIPTFNVSLSKSKMIVRDTALKDEIFNNYDRYENLLKLENSLDIELYEYFLDDIWPKQLKQFSIQSEPNTHERSALFHRSALLAAKLKRNLLYKPFVKFF